MNEIDYGSEGAPKVRKIFIQFSRVKRSYKNKVSIGSITIQSHQSMKTTIRKNRKIGILA